MSRVSTVPRCTNLDLDAAFAGLIAFGTYFDAFDMSGDCNQQTKGHFGSGRKYNCLKYCGKDFGAKFPFLGKVFEDFAPPLRGRFTMGKNSIVVIWTV